MPQTAPCRYVRATVLARQFQQYGKSAILVSEAAENRLLVWVASSKRDLKATPEEVQDQIGYALGEVQAGNDLPDYVARMKGPLRDVWEIKADDDDGATYRTTYVSVLGDDIYVLDTFKKKSKNGITTPQKDLDRIEGRLKQAREIYAKRRCERT